MTDPAILSLREQKEAKATAIYRCVSWERSSHGTSASLHRLKVVGDAEEAPTGIPDVLTVTGRLALAAADEMLIEVTFRSVPDAV